ncbi:MAG: hypothetical protein MI723_04520 [Caulobacterales bacterium]|nr:hypothetical protein [Caulobacterales bacterium]
MSDRISLSLPAETAERPRRMAAATGQDMETLVAEALTDVAAGVEEGVRGRSGRR